MAPVVSRGICDTPTCYPLSMPPARKEERDKERRERACAACHAIAKRVSNCGDDCIIYPAPKSYTNFPE